MPPRFDAEGLILELSVGDLVDATLARHLGFANRGGYERRWLGQAIHSRYQEAAMASDPTYQREVAITTTLEHRGWQVSVKGRLDGLRRDGEVLVVEEIKSVRRGVPAGAALREIYSRQALLYAWMLRRNGEEKVETELIWIQIGSEEVDRQELDFSFTTIDADVRKRLNTLLREIEQQRKAEADRQAAATRLQFPHDRLRPGQDEIVEAVERSLDQREHLFVEAPTGIGKTVAAVTPALRYALAHNKRLFVLTAKTLQQEMAVQVLRLLNHESSFHSLQLRAKAKMCANDQLLCHEEYCPYARDYYSKLQSSGLTRELMGTWSTLLPDQIFTAARDAEICPFEISLELSREGQVVICDYNYAFDPYVALSDFHVDNDLSDVVLVIDEIHNLVGRGRGYFSPVLSTSAALAAAESMSNLSQPVHRACHELCQEVAALIRRTVELALEETPGDARAVETQMPEDDLWALRVRLDEAFIDYLEFRKETSTFRAEDPFVDFYFGFLRFVDGVDRSSIDQPAFSHCAERDGDDDRLRVLCKDPSTFLGEILNRTHSAIGLSATLSPTDFYRDLLGFDANRLDTLSVASPFPTEHRSVVIDASVSTLYRKRPENYPKIAENLAAFADRVPGNCLALFPSYRFLDEVAGRLEVGRKRVLVQSSSGTDREREGILESLRSALAGDVLLMAVAGGVFAEGVDYPGEMLKAVAVIGPCLPAVSLEQELLRRYYDDRFERGFEYAFVVPGMTRVVQAAGRLIRSAEDTGVIALFDQRFLLQPYRAHLPGDWLDGFEPEDLVGRPADAARRFFAGTAPSFPRTEKKGLSP